MDAFSARSYCFPVMTRKEYSSKSEAIDRAISRWNPALVVSIFLGSAGPALSAYIKWHYHTNWYETTGVWVMGVVGIGTLVGMALSESHLVRKWGMCCP